MKYVKDFNGVDIRVPFSSGTYAIQSDKLNFIVGKLVPKTVEGKQIEVMEQKCSYFNSLEQAMQHMQTLLIKKMKSNSFQELHQAIKHSGEIVSGLYRTISDQELKDSLDEVE